MTGSLQIKNNRYYMVLNTRDRDGKSKLKWLRTGLEIKSNKKKAEQMLREILTTKSDRDFWPTEKLTFSDWIRRYLKDAEKRLDVVTFIGYEETARTHIYPYSDTTGVALQDVGRKTLQEFFDVKPESGRADGKGGLAPPTVRKLRNIISPALNEAARHRLIQVNPCTMATINSKTKTRNNTGFFNSETMTQLFRAIREDSLCPLIMTTALYGLRRSEVLGLQY